MILSIILENVWRRIITQKDKEEIVGRLTWFIQDDAVGSLQGRRVETMGH